MMQKGPDFVGPLFVIRSGFLAWGVFVASGWLGWLETGFGGGELLRNRLRAGAADDFTHRE